MTPCAHAFENARGGYALVLHLIDRLDLSSLVRPTIGTDMVWELDFLTLRAHTAARQVETLMRTPFVTTRLRHFSLRHTHGISPLPDVMKPLVDVAVSGWQNVDRRLLSDTYTGSDYDCHHTPDTILHSHADTAVALDRPGPLVHGPGA
jgi:hypothetical protein